MRTGCKNRNVLFLLYFCYEGRYSLLVQAPLVVLLVLDGVALLSHPLLVGQSVDEFGFLKHIHRELLYHIYLSTMIEFLE